MIKDTEGVVVEIKGEIANVKVGRHGECSNCGACPGDTSMIIEAHNKMGACPGQRVILKIPQNNTLKASFIIFMLPLLFTVIGVIFGVLLAKNLEGSKKAFELGTGFLFFVFSILYIRFFDQTMHTDHQAEIIHVM